MLIRLFYLRRASPVANLVWWGHHFALNGESGLSSIFNDFNTLRASFSLIQFGFVWIFFPSLASSERGWLAHPVALPIATGVPAG